MKIADKAVSWLLKNGADKEKERIISYGAECFFNELLADLLLVIFALLVHRILDTVIWIAAFTAVRVHLGGWHANTHIGCILSSTVIGGVCVLLSPVLNKAPAFIVIVLIVVSIGIIIKIAPVTHVNHPVSQARKAKARKRAIVISCIESVLALGLFFLPSPLFSPVFSALLSVTAFSILGGLVKTGK